jgi:hypothetical protein
MISAMNWDVDQDSQMANIVLKTNTHAKITFASIKTIFAMVAMIAVMVPTKTRNFAKVSLVTKFTNSNATISNVFQDIMFATAKTTAATVRTKII